MLALPVTSFAAAPSGTLNFYFTTNDSPGHTFFSPIYDLTGSYQLTQQVIGVDGLPIDVTFGISIVQDDLGRITGNDVTIIFFNGNVVGGEYKVRGKVTGAGGFARLRMHVHIVANGIVVNREVTRAVFDIDYDATTDLSGMLNGGSKGRVSFSGLGRGKINSEFSTTIPAGIDGSWVLTANVFPLRPLSGSATAVFQSGRIVLFNVSGSYSTRRDETSLRLRGVGPSRGAKLNLMLDGNSELLNLSGKILGQKVLLIPMTPAP